MDLLRFYYTQNPTPMEDEDLFDAYDNTSWKKKLTPQQKAEYKAEKREEMQNLFKRIDDGVKAVFESDSYKKCLRYMSKFTNYSAGNCILIMLQKPDASLVAAFPLYR